MSSLNTSSSTNFRQNYNITIFFKTNPVCKLDYIQFEILANENGLKGDGNVAILSKFGGRWSVQISWSQKITPFKEWSDPFDSIPLKLLTFFIYIVDVLAAVIILVFVSYEIRGLFGHYRTVINQLLSCAYGGVRYWSTVQ